MEKVIIIMPAYNEELRIARTLEAYGSFFSKMKRDNKIEASILIVINNTQDKTEEIVKEYRKKFRIISYLNFKQGGKGFAITEGFKEALKKDVDLIGFVDADMATSPEAFFDLLTNIKGKDGIIASRYVSGAKVSPKQTWQRILVSRVFNFLIRILFSMNYRDTQCGAKIFRKSAIVKVLPSLGMTQWAYDVDLLYQMKRNKIRVIEYPTTWSDKNYSKINIKKASTNMILGVVRLRLFYSPFKRIIKLYDKIITILRKWKI
jgi:glycosyltransferase involved in cell wall biosynthesis